MYVALWSFVSSVSGHLDDRGPCLGQCLSAELEFYEEAEPPTSDKEETADDKEEAADDSSTHSSATGAAPGAPRWADQEVEVSRFWTLSEAAWNRLEARRDI